MNRLVIPTFAKKSGITHHTMTTTQCLLPPGSITEVK